MAQAVCRYCTRIREHQPAYPVRRAKHALGTSYPRCDLHWRFVCAACGKARHFHGMAFCRRRAAFFCIVCAPENRAVERGFWGWRYYYALRCPWHGEWLPALDRLEHRAQHPWQGNPAWRRSRRGMDPLEEVLERWVSWTAPVEELTDEEIQKSWDGAAEWWVSRYTARGDVNREWVVDPILLDYLGNVKGLGVLDAGCGSGYLARLLAQRGARVEGVDLSRKLLAAAEVDEARDPLGIRYRSADLADLSAFASGSFDAVVSNIVLQDVRRFAEAIREIHRVLRPGGRFVFSITHPAFEAPVPGRWVKEPQDTERIEDRQYLAVDRYFDRLAVFWGVQGHPTVAGFHRPLRDYFEALHASGFLVARLEEPVPGEGALEKHYREFADLLRVPIFLVVEAFKPPSTAGMPGRRPTFPKAS